MSPGPHENVTRPGGTPTAPGRSLRGNILYAMFGNGVLNLCRLAVVVLLAKAASTEIQGVFLYTTTALAAPVVLFCGLELRAAFVADAGGEFTFGAYRALRTLGMGVAGVVLLVIVLWTTQGEPSGPLIWMMLALCASRIVFHLGEVHWGIYQRRERLDLMAWSNALRGLAQLAPFVILFLWPLLAGRDDDTPNREHLLRITAGAISAYVLAWAAIWWFFDRRRVAGHDANLSWDWPALGRLARQTLPLGLVLLLIHLCETVTQGLIKRAGGGEGFSNVGYFGAMRLITLAAMFLMMQVNTAAGNRLANNYQKDLPAFLRLATKLIGVALTIGVGFWSLVWLFGEWFLRLLYTPEHARHYPEFLILATAQAIVLLGVVFGSVTTHMRQFWIQVPVQLTLLAITAVAGTLLIQPDDPVRGGALTILVRSIAQAVLYLGCVLIGIRWRDRIVSAR